MPIALLWSCLLLGLAGIVRSLLTDTLFNAILFTVEVGVLGLWPGWFAVEGSRWTGRDLLQWLLGRSAWAISSTHVLAVSCRGERALIPLSRIDHVDFAGMGSVAQRAAGLRFRDATTDQLRDAALLEELLRSLGGSVCKRFNSALGEALRKATDESWEVFPAEGTERPRLARSSPRAAHHYR